MRLLCAVIRLGILRGLFGIRGMIFMKVIRCLVTIPLLMAEFILILEELFTTLVDVKFSVEVILCMMQ